MRQKEYLSVKKAIKEYKQLTNLNPFKIEKSKNNSARDKRRNCKNATKRKKVLQR